MPDTTWTIHTKSRGTITAAALTSDWPTVTRGSTARLRLRFNDDASNDSLVVGGGETYTIGGSETVTRQGATLDDGATLTMVDGATLTLQQSGLFLLLQYLDWAGAAQWDTSINRTPWYHEQLPSGYVDSIVLGFEPSAEIRDHSITGLWGLVTGGQDLRNSTVTNWTIELQVFVLAEFDEYPDHAALEADRSQTL